MSKSKCRVSVLGYEGIYSVDKYGSVWNDKGEYILEPHRGKYVCLVKSGVKKWHRVDRIVSAAWLPNTLGFEYVEHLNGDVGDCRVENLRFVSEKPKVLSAYAKEKMRKVWQMDRLGNLLQHYDSVGEASMRSGVSKSMIVRCCNGDLHSAGGWCWCYARL